MTAEIESGWFVGRSPTKRSATGGTMEFNLADLFEAVAGAVPDRTAVVAGDRHVSYRELNERADRLATLMALAGIGADDFVGVQLPNGNEYLEVMLAAFKVRAVPVNVNYRYVDTELTHLFADAGLVGLVAHTDFSDAVTAARGSMAAQRLLLWVGPGGDYEARLAEVDADPALIRPQRSGDDLYCVYTGGTTGFPKGVLWRHEDIFFASMGGGDPFQFGNHITRPDQITTVIPDHGMVALSTPPFMHAAGHWLAFAMLFGGGTVVTLPEGRFDPEVTWSMVEREKVNVLVIVGDAMARPLADALAAHPDRWDLSSLLALGSGGALFSPGAKARLRELKPDLIIRDAFGSSETGQLGGEADRDDPDSAPRLHLDASTTVLDDDLQPVSPGSGVVGRLARGGHVPLRYHDDPVKSAATFVEVDGRRWAMPGDQATVEADGTIVILGRASQCINTGGEKVYPEEVEAALRDRPEVADAVVVGVPDERWGQAVAAVVAPRDGARLTLDGLRSALRDDVAGYKLPRHLVLVDTVERLPSGKPDYRWAAGVATAMDSTGGAAGP